MIGDVDLHTIARSFKVDGEYLDCTPYGFGHIHKTYLARFCAQSGIRRYVIQQINSRVFANPPAMMENILRVTSHIRQKLQVAGCQDIERQVLSVMPSLDGLPYYRDDQGNYWRMYAFIEDAMSIEVPQDCQQVYEAARAFGSFDALLTDLPAASLHETMHEFHDGQARLEQLLQVLQSDPFNRAAQAKAEIDFILGHQRILLEPVALLKNGILRSQVTHNDTKVNNVLLDRRTGQGICVIDLDTVMEGIWLYDLGDILRTTASAVPEDEQDLAKVQICLDRYRAAVEGFFAGAQGQIDLKQLQYVPLSGLFMTLIMAARFLTDFLEGDRYFKTNRPNHNIDRCRCQCRLVQSMLQQQGQIDKIISSIL